MGIVNTLLSKLLTPLLKSVLNADPEYRKLLVLAQRMDDILLNTTLSPKALLYAPYKIIDSTIGDYSYLSHGAKLSQVTIGKCCSIGPNLLAGQGIHPIDGISTAPMFYSAQKQNGITFSETDKLLERKPIVIGNDVFIGANVTILDGVTIGDGAVIGAGAVVSKDIPAYAIAVGVPIQILKYRFEVPVIEKLLTLKWWDWPEEKLKTVEQYFFDVDTFLKENTH